VFISQVAVVAANTGRAAVANAIASVALRYFVIL
jgi:hypothetical protein